ncbi:MAG: hypothetical protein EXS08_00020 [Planctomycetes bacterium]|nr:hypothetical protein [Planctomycetota bacterium]
MSPHGRAALVTWCAPAAFLAAVLGGVAVVFSRPLALLWVVLGALVVVPTGWVLVSALFPGKAERRCPACAGETLVRLDVRTTQGLGCRACGWRDESASAWLLAEEEGPLEEIVLAQRGRHGAGPMDSSRRSG